MQSPTAVVGWLKDVAKETGVSCEKGKAIACVVGVWELNVGNIRNASTPISADDGTGAPLGSGPFVQCPVIL